MKAIRHVTDGLRVGDECPHCGEVIIALHENTHHDSRSLYHDEGGTKRSRCKFHVPIPVTKEVSKHELERKYRHMTVDELADEYGVSYSKMRHWMGEYGISKRPPGRGPQSDSQSGGKDDA